MLNAAKTLSPILMAQIRVLFNKGKMMSHISTRYTKINIRIKYQSIKNGFEEFNPSGSENFQIRYI
jgi:hypothetical protein